MFLKESVAVEGTVDPEFRGALIMRDTDHRAEWCRTSVSVCWDVATPYCCAYVLPAMVSHYTEHPS